MARSQASPVQESRMTRDPPLKKFFVREKRGDERRATTYLRKTAPACALFDSFEPIPSTRNMPCYWKNGVDCSTLRALTPMPMNLLEVGLVGKWSAFLYSETESRSSFFSSYVVKRTFFIKFWFELKEDYVLLKLHGFPI